MLGAIAGDIIGSVYEHHPHKSTKFPLFSERSRFTDDTVLTVATAHALLTNGDYTAYYQLYGRHWPNAGYGGTFRRWLRQQDPAPYNSWGNGSAMRVSPVGFCLNSEAEVLAEAERSAAVTHNHPEGIKGAQAVALAILLARQGADKATLRREISQRFGYDLERSLAEIRPGYRFDVSCQGSVPESIIALLEADDYEGAVRNAISLGGDADTMACIAGGIGEALFGELPETIRGETLNRLAPEFLEPLALFEKQMQTAASRGAGAPGDG
jgi:ADP-ribosylglycohydrolase